MSEASWQHYLIEPKAPLVIRSGRPFSEIAGSDPARFPPPSTLAGALRAAYARSQGVAPSTELLNIASRGPLVLKLDLNGRPQHVLVPKPADAHYFELRGEPMLVAARPVALEQGEGCDLPLGLSPLQFTRPVQGKPVTGPLWWRWEDFARWRQAPEDLSFAQVAAQGWRPPADDIRTHVSIDQRRRGSKPGLLFQTAGLTMWDTTPPLALESEGESEGDALTRSLPQGAIGLLAAMAGDMKACALNLGGERRLCSLQPCENLWPPAPADLAESIAAAGGLCLSLHSPALFRHGWLPGWLDTDFCGSPPGCDRLQLKLVAAAVNGWQPQSGWDLAKRCPRVARKMVPAGAAYWFEVRAADTVDLASLWWRSLCDEAQDRRDGFGLATVAPFTLAHNGFS